MLSIDGTEYRIHSDFCTHEGDVELHPRDRAAGYHRRVWECNDCGAVALQDDEDGAPVWERPDYDEEPEG